MATAPGRASGEAVRVGAGARWLDEADLLPDGAGGWRLRAGVESFNLIKSGHSIPEGLERTRLDISYSYQNSSGTATGSEETVSGVETEPAALVRAAGEVAADAFSGMNVSQLMEAAQEIVQLGSKRAAASKSPSQRTNTYSVCSIKFKQQTCFKFVPRVPRICGRCALAGAASGPLLRGRRWGL